MTTETFSVACVGAGYFAQFHHAAWQRTKGACLVAVADRDPGAAVPDGVYRHTDLASLLDSRQIDILDIATPPETHVGMIERAMAAGVTRIVCQKPFCGALDSARRMAGLAAEAGVDLIVHDNFRFQPWYRQLKTILDEGSLGQIYQISFSLRPGDGRGPPPISTDSPIFRP